MKLIYTLFTILVLSVALNAQMCPSPLYNQDIKGSDLYRVYVNDYQSCCDICQKNPECIGFTYYLDYYGYRICRLKKDFSGYCYSYRREN